MAAHGEPRDEFLSQEDLDLRNVPYAELLAWWELFLHQAQASNDLDEDEYSHGVYALPRAEWPWQPGEPEAPSGAGP